MRTFRPMLHVLFLIVIINFSNSEIGAQGKARLPPELTQNSSPAEIVAWLDQTSFANARVGLNDPGSRSRYQFGVEIQHSKPSAKAVVSKGFRLARLDGCHLTLRNEAVSVVDFSGPRHSGDVKTLLENRKGNTAGQLFMWLERVSYTKGKAPYRHTKNIEKARLLGSWRTKFTYRGFFARDVFSMSFSDPEQGPMREVMSTDTLTFTFDDRDAAEGFNAAFRQAIKLCQSK
jgi:hypothetical protein